MGEDFSRVASSASIASKGLSVPDLLRWQIKFVLLEYFLSAWKTSLGEHPNELQITSPAFALAKLLLIPPESVSQRGFNHALKSRSLLAVAVTFGIQNGNDRLLTDKIEAKIAELTPVARKIGAIKQRDLQTTEDYIQAYSEIEILLPEYASEINDFNEIVQESMARDQTRGAINIQRLYKSHRPEVQQNNLAIIAALRDSAKLMRQEVDAAHAMGGLPASRQPDFWKSDFRPLLVQDDSLRQTMATLQAKEAGLLK